MLLLPASMLLLPRAVRNIMTAHSVNITWLHTATVVSCHLYQLNTPINICIADQNWRSLRKPVLRDKLQYWQGFYIYLMVTNLALRLAWTYKLSPHLRQNLLTVLIFTLFEVFRRFQWIFVRIEVELRKLQIAKPELGPLIPALLPKEIINEDELLPI